MPGSAARASGNRAARPPGSVATRRTPVTLLWDGVETSYVFRRTRHTRGARPEAAPRPGYALENSLPGPSRASYIPGHHRLRAAHDFETDQAHAGRTTVPSRMREVQHVSLGWIPGQVSWICAPGPA